MNHFKIIQSHQDYEDALMRLDNLMDANPEPNSDEENQLDVLALLIESYEEKQYPIDLPSPVEAIKFRMDQQKLSQKDLIPFIGSASKVSEILSGKRQLSLNMIRKLSAGLGISAEVLIRQPLQEISIDTETDWQAFPLSEMRKRGYFEGFSQSMQELREYAAEEVGKFLSSIPNGFSLQPTLLRSSAHLRSNDKETNTYALWAWQVRVLQKAQEESLPVNYRHGIVDQDYMRKLAQLSWSDQGPLLAIEYLNRSGIHLIIEPHLPMTYLDGAACLNSLGNPVIALTLRHDRLDNFWFTLMHELAHIALHIDNTETWFIDDLDAEGTERVEKEADTLAQNALISSDNWQKIQQSDPSSIRALSQSLSLSPCIIAGRLRHETHNHRMFGKLFRDKVKHTLLCK